MLPASWYTGALVQPRSVPRYSDRRVDVMDYWGNYWVYRAATNDECSRSDLISTTIAYIYTDANFAEYNMLFLYW